MNGGNITETIWITEIILVVFSMSYVYVISGHTTLFE